MRFAIVALLAAAASGVVFAQAVANPEQQIPVGDEGSAGAPRPQPLVSTWDFVRMVAILAAVVAAIYLFFLFLRRSVTPARLDSDLIRLLGQRSLSGSRCLYLVEVGTSVYLVGASDAQVSLVAEIADKESLDAVRLATARSAVAPQPRKSFATVISGLFAAGARGLTPGDTLSFLRRQRDRLKRM